MDDLLHSTGAEIVQPKVVVLGSPITRPYQTPVATAESSGGEMYLINWSRQTNISGLSIRTRPVQAIAAA